MNTTPSTVAAGSPQVYSRPSSVLRQAVVDKLSQWDREALLFCAAHGRNGGEFITSKWASGAIMVEVPGGRANQAIPFDTFEALKANGWKIDFGSIGATTTEVESMLNGKVVDAFGIVRLVGRFHKLYHGPVRRWAGTHWILYNNRPVEVCRVDGRDEPDTWAWQEC